MMSTICQMTTVVKGNVDDVISIPADLMRQLGLRDGERVQATVENGVLRVKRIESFLALRGKFAGDDAFEKAIKEIDMSWQSWSTSASA